MAILSWTESVPSGTSPAGDAAHVRSVWTTITTGLSTDLFWDGGGGASTASRGDLQPGASRTFVAAQSASSNSGTGTIVGKALFASDTSRLLIYDSTGTWLGGTPFLLEYSGATANAVVTDVKDVLVEFSGQTTVTNVSTATTNGVSISLNVAAQEVALAPYVVSSEKSVLVRSVLNFTGFDTFFVLSYRGTTNAPSTATLYWTFIDRALGAL